MINLLAALLAGATGIVETAALAETQMMKGDFVMMLKISGEMVRIDRLLVAATAQAAEPVTSDDDRFDGVTAS